MSTDSPATDVLPRFIYQNFAKLSGITLSASSEDTQYPVEHIVDPLRSKSWRSKLGWNIILNFNDRLDFTEGVTGDTSAEITPGNYATGADLATEIQTQMNAAATDNTYAVTYDSTTKKFTIARDTGAATIGLEWSTGSNTARSIGADLGFDVSADDTGATSYTADNTCYKTREWVLVQLVDALDGKVAMVVDYNWDVTSGDQVSIQANATNAWSSPSYDQVLSNEHADGNISLLYFASTQTYQYWRLLIEDQFYNDAGFTEIGLFMFSGYLQLTRDFSYTYREVRNELSQALDADQGAPWLNVKESPLGWRLSWNAVTETDKSNLHTMQNFVKINRGFFFSFAPSTAPARTEYVKLKKGISFSGRSHNQYSVTIEIEQALG